MKRRNWTLRVVPPRRLAFWKSVHFGCWVEGVSPGRKNKSKQERSKVKSSVFRRKKNVLGKKKETGVYRHYKSASAII